MLESIKIRGENVQVRSRIILAVMLVALFSAAALSGCDRKSADAADPLKKLARERYAEGRRLFLTCDPNNFPAAIKAFDDALASWEDYPEALAAWAETVSMWYGFRLNQDVFEQAYVRAQRAIRLAPESDMGYRAMADLFRHFRDPETGKAANEEAMKSIERALAIAPDSAENLYVKGSILLATNPPAAIKVLEEALRLNPELAKIYFNLASAYQLAGDMINFSEPNSDPAKQEERVAKAKEYYAKAIKHLEIYQRLVPADLGGYTSLGIIYIHDQQFEKAEEVLKKAVGANVSPDPSQVELRALAYVYLAQIADQHHQDLNRSRDYLERAREANPFDSQIYKQLIRIAEIQKDPAGARKYEEMYQEMIEKAKAEMAAAQAGGTAGALPGSTAAYEGRPELSAPEADAPAPGGTPDAVEPPPAGASVP